MSLSNPQNNTNPAKRKIEWSGSKACWTYYDKDTEKNVKIEGDIYMIVLDQLNAIGGFSDEQQAGIYSNEVKDLKNEVLTVKFNGGVQAARGLYEEIKDSIARKGGKFIKVVYAVLIHPKAKDEKPDLELVRIHFSGSSIGPWIEAGVGDAGNVIVLGVNPEEKKKGANTYFEPTVTVNKVRKDIIEDAVEIDRELQKFFEERISGTHSQEQSNTAENKEAPATSQRPEEWAGGANDEEDDDLPF